MKMIFARRCAALIAFAIGLTTSALAQDKTAKIGVLNDMSSLYADIGGPNSVVAVKMAVEDSGLAAKGWKIDVLSGDHQNKPNMARHWIDRGHGPSHQSVMEPRSNANAATSGCHKTAIVTLIRRPQLDDAEATCMTRSRTLRSCRKCQAQQSIIEHLARSGFRSLQHVVPEI